MQIVSLEAQSRETGTNGQLTSMRNQGWVPAVIYNEKDKLSEKNTLIKIHEKTFLKSLTGHKASNMILEIKLGSQNANVVIKEIQRDVLNDHLLHIDFKRISMNEKIEVNVPLHLTGEAPGVKLHGGILEHITREVRVFCLPANIPDVINVDISTLEVGQHINVSDLPAIEGVEMMTETNHLIVHVVNQAAEEEPAATSEAAAPEVIAKGKKPEEGEAAAEGAKK